MELLAPARNLECGLAAVDCGADAVYIGAERFSAREDAANSVADIEKLITYAHKYWVKVYVALNTILKDEELPPAEKIIKQIYEAGADGLIIQDFGLLEIDLPPIPLIASTQMNNDSIEKIKFLEKVGFSRVILPREFTLEQIKEIKAKTNIDLECFVHGALCVCYSGQCYLSYSLGGRSANRGACAQPCRKPYTLQNEKGETIIKNKYLLSLKDLNLSEYLDELISVGITSFKIEGRLKDVNYVKNIVSFYRQLIDNIEQKNLPRVGGEGGPRQRRGGWGHPSKTFNRGYTSYFLYGRQHNLASLNTPKSIGEYIGKVSNVGYNFFEIFYNQAPPCGELSPKETEGVKLNNGDGLCFFDKSGQLNGTHVNTVEGCRIYPNKMPNLEIGQDIYRNYDQEFIKQLKQPIHRTINVNMIFQETSTGFKLITTDENNNQITEEIAIKKETAKNKEQALETIKKQLTKLGDTEFICEKIIIKTLHSQVQRPASAPAAAGAFSYFIPVSVLNNLRREVIVKLQQLRVKQYPRLKKQILKNNYSYPRKKLTYLNNVLNKKAEQFYLRHGVTEIEPAAESDLDLQGKKLMTTKYCLKYELGFCKKIKQLQPSMSINENDSKLFLLDDRGCKLKLEIDCTNCIMNIYI